MRSEAGVFMVERDFLFVLFGITTLTVQVESHAGIFQECCIDGLITEVRQREYW